MKRSSVVSEQEKYNLASEYTVGRDNQTPELGYPALTFDDYILLVRGFNALAFSAKRTPPPTMEDIEKALALLDQ